MDGNKNESVKLSCGGDEGSKRSSSQVEVRISRARQFFQSRMLESPPANGSERDQRYPPSSPASSLSNTIHTNTNTTPSRSTFAL